MNQPNKKYNFRHFNFYFFSTILFNEKQPKKKFPSETDIYLYCYLCITNITSIIIISISKVLL